MSERPTPETDASRGYALSSHYGRLEGSYLQMDRSGPFVHTEVARKLERERDEALEALEDWENAAAHVEADHPDEVHCGCVPVLRKLLTDARQERDEALEALEYIAHSGLSARFLEDYAREFLKSREGA